MKTTVGDVAERKMGKRAGQTSMKAPGMLLLPRQSAFHAENLTPTSAKKSALTTNSDEDNLICYIAAE